MTDYLCHDPSILCHTSHTPSLLSHTSIKPHGVGGSVTVILSVAVSAQSQHAAMSYDVVRTRIHRGGSAGFGPAGVE